MVVYFRHACLKYTVHLYTSYPCFLYILTVFLKSVSFEWLRGLENLAGLLMVVQIQRENRERGEEREQVEERHRYTNGEGKGGRASRTPGGVKAWVGRGGEGFLAAWHFFSGQQGGGLSLQSGPLCCLKVEFIQIFIFSINSLTSIKSTWITGWNIWTTIIWESTRVPSSDREELAY